MCLQFSSASPLSLSLSLTFTSFEEGFVVFRTQSSSLTKGHSCFRVVSFLQAVISVAGESRYSSHLHALHEFFAADEEESIRMTIAASLHEVAGLITAPKVDEFIKPLFVRLLMVSPRDCSELSRSTIEIFGEEHLLTGAVIFLHLQDDKATVTDSLLNNIGDLLRIVTRKSGEGSSSCLLGMCCSHMYSSSGSSSSLRVLVARA